MFARIRTFLNEVSGELKKATWPWDLKEKGFKRYQSLVNSTVMVLIAMLLLAGYIALWDLIFLKVFGALTTGGWG